MIYWHTVPLNFKVASYFCDLSSLTTCFTCFFVVLKKGTVCHGCETCSVCGFAMLPSPFYTTKPSKTCHDGESRGRLQPVVCLLTWLFSLGMVQMHRALPRFCVSFSNTLFLFLQPVDQSTAFHPQIRPSAMIKHSIGQSTQSVMPGAAPCWTKRMGFPCPEMSLINCDQGCTTIQLKSLVSNGKMLSAVCTNLKLIGKTGDDQTMQHR